MRQIPGRDARAVVADRQADKLARARLGMRPHIIRLECDPLGHEPHLPAVEDRIASIEHQVHQHLFDHADVAMNEEGIGGVVALELNILADDALEHPGEVDEGLIEVEGVGLEDLFAVKGEELPGQIGGARSGCDDLLEAVVGFRRVPSGVQQQQVSLTADDGQHVVEVVGDPAGELADDLHLLRLPQLLFQQLAAGDVFQAEQHFGLVFQPHQGRRDREVDLPPMAALRQAHVGLDLVAGLAGHGGLSDCQAQRAVGTGLCAAAPAGIFQRVDTPQQVARRQRSRERRQGSHELGHGPIDALDPVRGVHQAEHQRYRVVDGHHFGVVPFQAGLRLLAVAAFRGVMQSAAHRRDQALQAVFEHIIGGARPQTLDRALLADGAGDKDERGIRLQLPGRRQRFGAVVGGQRVIAENQIDVRPGQGGFKLRPALAISDFADHAAGGKQLGH